MIDRVRRADPADAARPTVEDALLADRVVSATDLATTRIAARQAGLPLADVLVARGHVTEAQITQARAHLHGLGIADLDRHPPDPHLATVLAARVAIAGGAVPLRRSFGRIVLAIADPDLAPDVLRALPSDTPVTLTLAAPSAITRAQVTLYGPRLARLAEGRAPERDSCRTWRQDRTIARAGIWGLTLASAAVIFPAQALIGFCLLALAVLYANVALKIAALAAALRARRLAAAAPPAPGPLQPPTVTLLVPLYKERKIASTLVAHLSMLDYPPECLDVLLLTEADDVTTNRALDACDLPPWMRRITVPPGQPRTKPRALNFGLNFARGDIVGVYDAEDRPEPDQIAKVAAHFAQVSDRVACLQGRLDYYNAPLNALARAFTIEYACWFRVKLPGVQRLGLFVPLGGTTVFFRRAPLEAVGAWDAHNVTEDAELGLRLARRGFTTEIVETTTFEEANAAVLPWIKQRSRWQKGYLMTWAAAMQRPRALLRDLGAWRFFGLQVQVLCAVMGFLLAPVLWSLVVKPFGMAHPLDAVFTPFGYGILATTMVASLVMAMTVSWVATREAHLKRHRPWIPFLEVYHALGTLAAWRALAEIAGRPFFWSKTEHGEFGGTDAPPRAECRSDPPLP